MESFQLDKDIDVFYVTAASFPDGVMEAFDKLNALLPKNEKRTLYGISFPDRSGKIIYRAAAEAKHPGEGSQLGCESFVIQKGKYESTTVRNFMTNLTAVRQAFDRMLKNPKLHPQGYCLEIYANDHDVQCLVKLTD
jgi:hypothetical protein